MKLIVYFIATIPVTLVNFLAHAMNCVIMCVDAWIVAHPLRLCHVTQPMIFGLVYTTFSVIYYLSGGTDPYVIFQIQIIFRFFSHGNHSAAKYIFYIFFYL